MNGTVTDLMQLLDEYDPHWVNNFSTLRDAAEHFGLEHMLEGDEDDDEYVPLDFN